MQLFTQEGKIKLCPQVADSSGSLGLCEAVEAWLEKATGPQTAKAKNRVGNKFCFVLFCFSSHAPEQKLKEERSHGAGYIPVGLPPLPIRLTVLSNRFQFS